MYNVGDWGWAIGAIGGGVLYYALSVRGLKAAPVAAE